VVEITSAEKVGKLMVWFDECRADLDKPVTVKYAGKALFSGTLARTVEVMVKTLVSRGDPKLIFDAEVSVVLPGGN
jgi:hypothetical protein